MIGQAGIIAGLMGPLVWEGLGFDTWVIRNEFEDQIRTRGDINHFKVLDYALGLFARKTETIYK